MSSSYLGSCVVMTPEEYAAQREAAERTQCAGCNKQILRSEAFFSANSQQDYCTEDCRDRSEAPMVKRSPKGLKIDGWDL